VIEISLTSRARGALVIALAIIEAALLILGLRANRKRYANTSKI